MHSKWILIAGLFVGGMSLYVAVAALWPYVFAFSRLKIETSVTQVTVKTVDANVMFNLGFVVFPLSFVPFSLGIFWGIIGLIVGIMVWTLGSTIEIQVSKLESKVIHRFLFFTWKTQGFKEVPVAFIDGWGDFIDPEAVNIRFGKNERVELAWVSRGQSGQHFVAQFNDAIQLMNTM
jgi:hypothetical protein